MHKFRPRHIQINANKVTISRHNIPLIYRNTLVTEFTNRINKYIEDHQKITNKRQEIEETMFVSTLQAFHQA